jgi:hypothetical protein
MTFNIKFGDVEMKKRNKSKVRTRGRYAGE